MQEIITGLRVQYPTNLAKLAFAYKSFRSLYSHALLILAKSCEKLECETMTYKTIT